MAQIKPEIETFAKIKVVGVGGGGGSALNRMINEGIQGVEFIALNTDVQALYHNLAETKLHIGKNLTRGLGAGMDPDIGKRAAEESQNEIKELLAGSDMVFITAGMGGGTGTGAAPVVANIAKELGALVVAVITKPFSFEGLQRMKLAENGIEELSSNVDTLITIPNEKLFKITTEKLSLQEAFRLADDILRQGIQGISELISLHGYVNVDFADIKSIMSDAGSALMGVGQAKGENRASEAAKLAINSPLLDMSIDGAKGILFTITGGPDLGVHEFDEAAKIITASADENARIIFGTIVDNKLEDEIRVTVIATGFDGNDNGVGGISNMIGKINVRKNEDKTTNYYMKNDNVLNDTSLLFKQTVSGNIVDNKKDEIEDNKSENNNSNSNNNNSLNNFLEESENEMLEEKIPQQNINKRTINLDREDIEKTYKAKKESNSINNDAEDDIEDIPAIIRNKMLKF